jgi:catechol 2,3-dioxygenase-like lactoylglutathione lyase family enzyme
MLDHRPVPEERPARIPPGGPPPTAVGSAVMPPGQRYLVVRGGHLIGRSRLEYPLDAGGAAAGRFFPGPAWEKVQEVFSRGHAALARGDDAMLRRYREELGALGFRIRDQDGREMEGRVDLISEWEDGRMIVHTTLPDPLYWERTTGGDL